MYIYGLPWWLRQYRICLQCRRLRFDPWVGRSSGDGNGNPLQYSRLENPMDSGAWWVTIHRVAIGHNWVLDTTEQHTHTHTHTHVHMYILFQILFYYRLLQYSSLCYIAVPVCYLQRVLSWRGKWVAHVYDSTWGWLAGHVTCAVPQGSMFRRVLPLF